MRVMRRLFFFLRSKLRQIRTFFYCCLIGVKYDSSWTFYGRPYMLRPSIFHTNRNTIQIGKNFIATSQFPKNSIGVFQPVLLNARHPNSLIVIGNNVGMSGCTVKAMSSVTIGNNVLVGSGVLISDNDSHPLLASERHDNTKIAVKPIVIEDDVFIGARAIILKGVTIGKGAVVGAGAVVSADVEPYTIVAGNPAKKIKDILQK